MANLQRITDKVAMRLRHGEFDFKYNKAGELKIVGEGSYEGEDLGTVSLKWPYKVKRKKWKRKGQ